jgi:hypothetical protein
VSAVVLPMKPRQRSIDVTTEEALNTWASQKRTVYADILWWKPTSVIGKLMEEGPGIRRTGKPAQKWDELYTGDGLVVQRIVSKLSGPPRLVLSCYYLVGGWVPVREQCAAIGVTRAQYWPALAAGEEAVSVALQMLEEAPAIAELRKLIAKACTS